MILAFVLIHNLYKMQFPLQHMALMLQDMGIIIKDNFSENKGLAYIHHAKKIKIKKIKPGLFSPQQISLNPVIFSKDGPSQKKYYWVCLAKGLWGLNTQRTLLGYGNAL